MQMQWCKVHVTVPTDGSSPKTYQMFVTYIYVYIEINKGPLGQHEKNQDNKLRRAILALNYVLMQKCLLLCETIILQITSKVETLV